MKQIIEILDKFEINKEDVQRIRDAGKILKLEIDEHISGFYVWLAKHEVN